MPKGVYIRTQEHKAKLAGIAGRARILRGGGYHAIHKWLTKHFGKADRCENPDCKGISKRYCYAKLADKDYAHDRGNFILLCASCHRLYDQKPEWIEKAAAKKRGIKLTEEHKRKQSLAMQGRYFGSNNPNWKGGKYVRA